MRGHCANCDLRCILGTILGVTASPNVTDVRARSRRNGGAHAIPLSRAKPLVLDATGLRDGTTFAVWPMLFGGVASRRPYPVLVDE
jgi:hypothetical protein